MNESIDWMDEWGWTDEWIDGYGWMNRWTDEWMY